MSTITIPVDLESAFRVSEPSRICDENGNVLGYYTPRRAATEDDYTWAMRNITEEHIEASLASGQGRTFGEIIAELRGEKAQ